MKTLGIILAAGRSSRLYPATLATSKQLLPIYDKPLIYYPLSLLMLGKIRDIALITNPAEQDTFRHLMVNSYLSKCLHIGYWQQVQPKGLPDAFNIVEPLNIVTQQEYDNVALILGDNIHHGAGVTGILQQAVKDDVNAQIFVCRNNDLSRFGVITMDHRGEVVSIVEKPKEWERNSYAITGLYVFPKDVWERTKALTPSDRGETEITDLIKGYLADRRLKVNILPRGVSWFDTGTPDSLMAASQYVQAIQTNQGQIIGSPHEVAWNNGWLSRNEAEYYIAHDKKSDYSAKLLETINN